MYASCRAVIHWRQGAWPGLIPLPLATRDTLATRGVICTASRLHIWARGWLEVVWARGANIDHLQGHDLSSDNDMYLPQGASSAVRLDCMYGLEAVFHD